MGNESSKMFCSGQIKFVVKKDWKRQFLNQLSLIQEQNQYSWAQDIVSKCKNMHPEQSQSVLVIEELHESVYHDQEEQITRDQLREDQFISQYLSEELTNSIRSTTGDQTKEILLNSLIFDTSGLDFNFQTRENQISKLSLSSAVMDQQCQIKLEKIKKQILFFNKVKDFFYNQLSDEDNILYQCRQQFLVRITRKIQDKSLLSSSFTTLQLELEDIYQEIIVFLKFLTEQSILYYDFGEVWKFKHGVLLTHQNIYALLLHNIFSNQAFYLSLISMQRQINANYENHLKQRYEQFRESKLLQNTDIFGIKVKYNRQSFPFYNSIEELRTITFSESPLMKYKVIQRCVELIKKESRVENNNDMLAIFAYVIINSQIPTLHIDSQLISNLLQIKGSNKFQLQLLSNALDLIYKIQFDF